jgi:hypothetical protein
MKKIAIAIAVVIVLSFTVGFVLAEQKAVSSEAALIVTIDKDGKVISAQPQYSGPITYEKGVTQKLEGSVLTSPSTGGEPGCCWKLVSGVWKCVPCP